MQNNERRAFIESEKEKTKVPEMTDPLGKYWNNPDRHKILICKDIAVMSKRSFKILHEYSTSLPSGTYTGKMWKRQSTEGWKLVWYGDICESDNTIAIYYRKIAIL